MVVDLIKKKSKIYFIVSRVCPNMPGHAHKCSFLYFSRKLMQKIFLTLSEIVYLCVLLISAKTACLKLFSFLRYFEKGSQPIRLLHFSNLNISWTTYVYTPKFCMVVDVIEKKSKIYFIVSRVCPNMPGHAHKCGFSYFSQKSV